MGLIKWLDKRFEETCLMVMLLLINLIIGYSVFMRYAVQDSLSWAEEVTRYLFVWSAFLSLSYCVRIGTSIRIDIVMQSLPNHFKKLNMLLVDVIQIAFFAYCLKGGVNVTQSMINSGQSSPALNAPMYFVYGASAVGFALGIARSLQHMLTSFKPEKIDAKTAKVGE